MIDNPLFLIAAVFGSILLSMTLHEAMHAFVGYWLGDDTAKYAGRLSLKPIRHIDPFFTLLLPLSLLFFNYSSLTSRNVPVFGAAKPVPFNPARLKWDEFGAALVGLAGPLTNLALAAVTAVVLRLFGVPGATLTELLLVFAQVNVGFFVFNMIPFPPLDGSRALFALAPEPVQDVMRQIESFGLSGIFIFMFVLFPVISPIVLSINRSILGFLLG
jgi:Zn-dependent protease